LIIFNKLQDKLGKIRSILGIPWLKSVRNLWDEGVTERLIQRLIEAGMSPDESERALSKAVNSLWGIERMAFVSLIKGEGYKTLWNSGNKS